MKAGTALFLTGLGIGGLYLLSRHVNRAHICIEFIDKVKKRMGYTLTVGGYELEGTTTLGDGLKEIPAPDGVHWFRIDAQPEGVWFWILRREGGEDEVLAAQATSYEIESLPC